MIKNVLHLKYKEIWTCVHYYLCINITLVEEDRDDQ